MEQMLGIGSVVVVAIVALLTLAIVFSRLYRRATKETAFVRTGMGGEKIIKDGGALVVPVLHDTTAVNLTTLKLALRRHGKEGLITRDRMRVDVTADFYVRVKPEDSAIAAAAQTLGEKTEDPEGLKLLIEGKLVDALRAVAAQMTLIELHEQRQDFVQNVQKVVSKDIEKNGLELESVSLTGLDQTSKDSLDPNNVFDAEGLRLITHTVETKRKERNDIERETEVAIERRDLEATQQSQQLRREREFVQLDTEREISERKASTTAQTAQYEAEGQREAERARIEAEREIEEANLARQEAIAIRAARKRQAEQLAEQEREIAVAQRSRDESKARAEADEARALAVRAEESVRTAQAEEEANRSKRITLIEAEKQAEQDAISIRVAAKVEKEAAEDRAEAVRIEAQAKAEAEKTTAEGTRARYNAEAEGQKALNEAMNLLSSEQIQLRLSEALIAKLPEIIEQAVKPMEKIDSIRIMDMGGVSNLMGAGTNGSGEGKDGGGGSLADQVVSASLRHRTAAPLLDTLMSQVGMSGGSLDGLLGPAKGLLEGNKSAGDGSSDEDAGEEPAASAPSGQPRSERPVKAPRPPRAPSQGDEGQAEA